MSAWDRVIGSFPLGFTTPSIILNTAWDIYSPAMRLKIYASTAWDHGNAESPGVDITTIVFLPLTLLSFAKFKHISSVSYTYPIPFLSEPSEDKAPTKIIVAS